MSNSQPSSSIAAAEAAEAARYALLRRLAFAIRHDLLAHLQPITMTGELLERRLRAPQPDLDQVRDVAARITGLSRGAVQASLDVTTWLAPEPGRVVTVEQLVEETVSLLASSFGFQGFTLRSGVTAAPWLVPRAGLRQLIPAGLFLLADGAGPPAEISVRAEAQGGQVCVTLALEPVDGPEGLVTEPPYRALTTHEVLALAEAEGIALTHAGDVIELRLPQASADEAQ